MSSRPGFLIAADAVAHPIGQLFLRGLFLVVIPLVFSSLALGVAGLGDVRKLGRIGARVLLFFVITTGFSAVLGLFAMNTLQPGVGFDDRGDVLDVPAPVRHPTPAVAHRERDRPSDEQRAGTGHVPLLDAERLLLAVQHAAKLRQTGHAVVRMHHQRFGG